MSLAEAIHDPQQSSHLIKSSNSWPDFALQKLQGSSSSSADVAHLVSKTGLLHSCNAVTTADDGDGSLNMTHDESPGG